ncbi:MAG: dockerin type I domain-containing protein, partial [Planctomycetota bacterium]
ITPVGFAYANENVRVLNSKTQTVSAYVNGVAKADLAANQMYAIVFQPQTMRRIYRVSSSAGPSAFLQTIPTNFLMPTDVSGDGSTTPLDAILVINQLTSNASRANAEATIESGGMMDVNQDNQVSPLDALLVINELLEQANIARGEDKLSHRGLVPVRPNLMEEEQRTSKMEGDKRDRMRSETNLFASTSTFSDFHVDAKSSDIAIQQIFEEEEMREEHLEYLLSSPEIVLTQS